MQEKCLLHISRSDAQIVPRCYRLGQCEWIPDPESAVGASSGGRRPIGSRMCTMQLRVVMNKASSPYKPGSRTILYDSLVPTNANVRIARHSANVNGVPTRCRMVSSLFASDYIGGQSGHRIGQCEAGKRSWLSSGAIADEIGREMAELRRLKAAQLTNNYKFVPHRP